MANKVVVLDTNVLLHDPQAPTRFGDRNVVLPMQVIEEIDRFKRDPSEKGRNARLIARFLDAHRVKGSLSKGVPLEGPMGELFRWSSVAPRHFNSFLLSCAVAVVTTTSWRLLWSRCDRGACRRNLMS